MRHSSPVSRARQTPAMVMTEPRFRSTSQSLDLERLLDLTGARVTGAVEAPLAITGVGSPGWSGPSDLACLNDPGSVLDLAGCRAGACLVPPELAAHVAPPAVALVSEHPNRAFARVAAALYPSARRPEPLFGPGAAGSAVHPEARLEPDVSVEAGAVIGPRAEIGRGAVIGANAVIGTDVRIGRDSVVGQGAVVTDALLGDRVALQPGVSVGHAGGCADGAFALGRVIIQDDVVVGANSTIARGALDDTVVGERTRIGTRVDIGADVMIGRACVVFAGERLSDGERLDDFSTLGGAGRRLASSIASSRPPESAPQKDQA